MKISKRVMKNISNDMNNFFNIVAFVSFLQILAIMVAFVLAFTQYKYLVDIVHDVLIANGSNCVEIYIEENQDGEWCYHERY